MMTIKYKKKHINVNLILAIVWLALSFITNYDSIFGNSNFENYYYLVISLIYFVVYFYQKKKQYIEIKNGVLKINGDFSTKKVKLSDVKQIKTFAGDYILKTDKKDFTINTQIINHISLERLNTLLKKLNIEWI